MSSTVHGYPTVSHVFTLPPETAAAALDVMILDPAVADRLLPTGALRRARPGGYGALRKLPGVLLLPGRLTRIEVILELLPWSAQRTELAIWTTHRPSLLRVPSVAAYLDAAHRTLTTLEHLMEPADPEARWAPVFHRQATPCRGAAADTDWQPVAINGRSRTP
jgi:hypothetical protein